MRECVCVCVYVAFVFEAQNVVQEAKQCARQGRLLRKRFASAVQAPRKVFATGSISNIAPFASRSMSFKSCVHRLGGGGAQSRSKSRPNSTEALPKCCASAVQALCKRCASCVQAGPVCMQATLLRMSPVWRSPHFVFLKVRASIPLYNIKRTEAEKEG